MLRNLAAGNIFTVHQKARFFQPAYIISWQGAHSTSHKNMCTQKSTHKNMYLQEKDKVKKLQQRVYLETKFEEKNEVKRLGACWDTLRKQWYTSNGDSASVFAKWNQQRVYLDVPIEEKDEAKALGARFGSYRGQWYTMAGEDMTKFSRWPISQKEDSEFDRTYFKVPFEERATVKEIGGRFDPERKLWFLVAGNDQMHAAKWPRVSSDFKAKGTLVRSKRGTKRTKKRTKRTKRRTVFFNPNPT